MPIRTMNLKQIHCDNCGADLKFDPHTQLVICNYCGSTFDIETAREANINAPDGIVPFKVAKESFDEAVLNWLVGGDYTPDDVLQGSFLKEVTGIYQPIYLYHGSYKGHYSAAVGFDRRETYTDYETYFDNGKKKTRPVTRYRTVTDWRPVSGQFQGGFSLLGSASRMLDVNQQSFCEESSVNKLDIKEVNDLYLQGYALETFDQLPAIVFDERVESRLNKIIDKDVHGRLSGDRQRDTHWDASIEKDHSALLLPFWMASYAYGNTTYHVLLDGQNSSRIIGNRPIDQDRVNHIRSLYLPLKVAAGVGLGWIALSWFAKSHVDDSLIWTGVICAVTWGLAEWRKHQVLEASKQLRQRALSLYKQSHGKVLGAGLSLNPNEMDSTTVKHRLPSIVADWGPDRWAWSTGGFIIFIALVTVFGGLISNKPSSQNTVLSAIPNPNPNSYPTPVVSESSPKVVMTPEPENSLSQDSTALAQDTSTSTESDAQISPDPQEAANIPVNNTPSFDCNKDLNDVEKMICSSPTLSAVDQQLSESYREAMQVVINKDSLKSQQKKWLTQRNQCSTELCIQDAYTERDNELKAQINSATQQ